MAGDGARVLGKESCGRRRPGIDMKAMFLRRLIRGDEQDVAKDKSCRLKQRKGSTGSYVARITEKYSRLRLKMGCGRTSFDESFGVL